MTASMEGYNTLHLCPSPECAARGHHPVNTYPAAINPGAGIYPNPLPVWQGGTFDNPSPVGMFWTPAQLSALMDEVRKTERATVLAELELLKESNDSE